MSGFDEVAAARVSLGGPPEGWSPVQFVAALQVNLGQAAMAAMVLDGARTDELGPEEALVVWRRALASIAAVSVDALEAGP